MLMLRDRYNGSDWSAVQIICIDLCGAIAQQEIATYDLPDRRAAPVAKYEQALKHFSTCCAFNRLGVHLLGTSKPHCSNRLGISFLRIADCSSCAAETRFASKDGSGGKFSFRGGAMTLRA